MSRAVDIVDFKMTKKVYCIVHIENLYIIKIRLQMHCIWKDIITSLQEVDTLNSNVYTFLIMYNLLFFVFSFAPR